MTVHTINFPRKIENHPQYQTIKKKWNSQLQTIWSGGKLKIPVIKADKKIWECLKLALAAHHLIQGTDLIDRKLKSEQKGINHSKATNYSLGSRMSRLMIIFKGGSDRFYKNNEKMLEKYKQRVAGIIIDATTEEVSRNLFNKEGKQTKVVLITNKEILVKFISTLS